MNVKHYIPEIEKMDRNMRRIAAVPLEMDRAIRRIAAVPLEIEKMQHQMLPIVQISPQKTVKAISEPEPPKTHKSEPMSLDNYKDDPYVHVHSIC